METVRKVGKGEHDGLPIMLRPVSKIPASGCAISQGNRVVVGRLNPDGRTEFWSDENGRPAGGIGPGTKFKAVTDGRGNVQAVIVAD